MTTRRLITNFAHIKSSVLVKRTYALRAVVRLHLKLATLSETMPCMVLWLVGMSSSLWSFSTSALVLVSLEVSISLNGVPHPASFVAYSLGMSKIVWVVVDVHSYNLIYIGVTVMGGFPCFPLHPGLNFGRRLRIGVPGSPILVSFYQVVNDWCYFCSESCTCVVDCGVADVVAHRWNSFSLQWLFYRLCPTIKSSSCLVLWLGLLTLSTLSNFIGLFHSLFWIQLKLSVGVKGLKRNQQEWCHIWSLLPRDGSGVHLSINEGWEVNSRSSVFLSRVGKSTTCSSARSFCMPVNLLLTLPGTDFFNACSVTRFIYPCLYVHHTLV